MPRDKGAARQLRSRIAHLAARMMAEDGVDDLALAKRKAARQVHASENGNLPTNDEVKAELHAYLQLYQADEQAARIAHLRGCALNMMDKLEQFNPHLAGSVLEGDAGRYCGIELHLFADNAKIVELFLLNNRISYQPRDRQIYRGDKPDTVSAFAVTTDDGEFDISVFDHNDLRHPIRNSARGRPLRRVGLKSLLEMQGRAGKMPCR
jgi:hypothetical protein